MLYLPGGDLTTNGAQLGSHCGRASSTLRTGELRNDDRGKDSENHHHDENFDQGETP